MTIMSISSSIMSMNFATILDCYVENKGVEPLTPCLQSKCSSQLS